METMSSQLPQSDFSQERMAVLLDLIHGSEDQQERDRLTQELRDRWSTLSETERNNLKQVLGLANYDYLDRKDAVRIIEDKMAA